MCDKGLMSQCETTQVREYGTGAAFLGYTKLYGQVPGGQAEFLRVPQAQFGPIKVPEGPPDDRFVYLSDVLPTAWQAVEYADIPDGGDVLVLGLGPIGEMSCRIAQHRGAGHVMAVDLVPERLDRARAHGVDVLNLEDHDDLPEVVREMTGGRGPIAVIDAVGMEAHGAPVGKLAQRWPASCPTKRLEDDRDGGHGPVERAAHGHRAGPARREHLAVRRLRRRCQPDAPDPDVRQAGERAHG